ncbi:MAG: S8 family serine peptidase [Halolamina sp.]
MTDNSDSSVSRRTFTKLGGATLGISGLGGVVAAESSEQYIVKQHETGTIDGEVVHDLSEVGYAVVRSTEDRLDASRGVESFAPDTEISFTNTPEKTREYEGEAADDDYYALQWDKQDLDISTAHETTKGEGTRVAVIDSGIDAGHPDLEVNTDLSIDFTGDGLGVGVPGGGSHGTHVAGIVGAGTAGTTGVAGTAPATELVDFRVFSAFDGGATFGDVVAAMVYAARADCDVANLSLGAYPIPRQGLGSFYGGFLNKATTWVTKEGTLIVVAAGNDAADLQHDGDVISLPNEAAEAVSVSATGPIGFGWDAEDPEPAESPAFYTNYGTNALNLGAPGGDADLDAIGTGVEWYFDLVFNTVSYPTIDGDGNYAGASRGYGWKAGTSMAAPNVAGAAALVKSANPDYNANQVRTALEDAAEVPDGYGKEFYGAGYLNVVDAL